MKPLKMLALFTIPMGIIIAAVPQNKTFTSSRIAPDELLNDLNTRTQYVAPDVVADMIVKKDPSLRLIDVRNQADFEKFSLPGAVNIPLTDLLSDKYADILNQDVRMNVFYSNGTIDANEAWMITRQMGYKNNYVLEGGLNYWFEAILNPQKPASASPDEEFARYDFRKGASQALGGGGTIVSEKMTASSSPKPALIPAAKKKKAAGGC